MNVPTAVAMFVANFHLQLTPEVRCQTGLKVAPAVAPPTILLDNPSQRGACSLIMRIITTGLCGHLPGV